MCYVLNTAMVLFHSILGMHLASRHPPRRSFRPAALYGAMLPPYVGLRRGKCFEAAGAQRCKPTCIYDMRTHRRTARPLPQVVVAGKKAATDGAFKTWQPSVSYMTLVYR